MRFKRRVVNIHCFANGNGRHSRLMADIIIEKVFRLMADIIIEKVFKQPLYSWGAKNLVKHGEVRKSYLNSLQKADAGNYTALIDFARS